MRPTGCRIQVSMLLYVPSTLRTTITPEVLIQKYRVFETLHSVFNTYSIYHYTIINYNNPIALLDSNWSVSVSNYNCALLLNSHRAGWAGPISEDVSIFRPPHLTDPMYRASWFSRFTHFIQDVFITVRLVVFSPQCFSDNLSISESKEPAFECRDSE